MKKSFLFIACCLLVSSIATASNGILSNSLSEKAFMGKRYIEGKKALKQFQNGTSEKEIEEKEVKKAFFFKNYKRLFSKIFAIDESGQVIQIRQLDESGKWESLIDKETKIKPASAQEAWDSLELADEFLLIDSQIGPCEFCEGSRYVIYFPEEVTAFIEHIKKNHQKHDPCKVTSSRYLAAQKEQKELAIRAHMYDWDEVSDLSTTSRSYFYGDEYACCWTELHEKGNRKFRHMCPVCKGKKTIPSKRIVRFIIDKN